MGNAYTIHYTYYTMNLYIYIKYKLNNGFEFLIVDLVFLKCLPFPLPLPLLLPLRPKRFPRGKPLRRRPLRSDTTVP